MSLDLQHRLTPTHRSGRQAQNHAINQGLQAAGEAGKDGLRRLPRAPLHSLDKTALLGFHADESRHDGANTELGNVSSEDRGQQRPGNGAGDFLPEVAAHKVGHRFVLGGRGGLELRRALGLAQVGKAGLPAEEWRLQQRTPFGRDHHAHSVRYGDEVSEAFATHLHVGAAPLIVGGDDLVSEAKLYRQLGGPGLFRHPGVRAALDNETLAVNGLYDAAEALRGLKKDETLLRRRQVDKPSPGH